MKTFLPQEWENVRSDETKPSVNKAQDINTQTSSSNNNDEDTRLKVESVVNLIEQSKVDITIGYDAWLKIGFALSDEFQETGREFFHCVSRQNGKYDQRETDKQYDKCLSAKGSGVTIATFFQLAKDAGIDISASKIQNIENGFLDFWNFGSSKKRNEGSGNVDGTTSEIQKSKNPKFQSGVVGSKWILDEAELPHFPIEIYDSLPSFLKEVLSNCISDDDRDMMLMGALACLSATLNNVVGEYDNDDWAPMIYFFVMADAGMGKGSLKYCRQLVAPIHNELREISERQIKEYKASKKESKQGDDTSSFEEEPHRRTLFIPTNSSVAAVIQQLDDNGGIGLIFDTECDTLSAALKSEYGDYSTIIRKGFHHEPIDLNRRKDDEYRVIENPMLAVCLSGTPGQLYTLTPQAEDGTFSRITCYHIPFKMEFRNVLVERTSYEQGKDVSLRDRFYQLGIKYKLMREAFFRGGDYRIVIPQQFCDEFNAHYKLMNQETVEDISHDMQSVVRRLAFTIFRIMMLFTSIRFMCEQPNPSAFTPKNGGRIVLRCTREDFVNAMAIGDVLIYHTVYCYAHFPRSRVATSIDGKILSKKDRMNILYDTLPETFDKSQYVAASTKLGYSPSTTSKWINSYILEGRLGRKGQNDYCKVATFSLCSSGVG